MEINFNINKSLRNDCLERERERERERNGTRADTDTHH